MSSPNLSLRYYPDPALRVKCTPCEWPAEECLNVGKEMINIMWANDGMGLAAPQVGLTQRLFVMRDPHNPLDKDEAMIFVNPILEEHGHHKFLDFEGCLSLMKVKTKVKRWRWIEFSFDDLDDPGQRLHWRFEDLNARCVQHEIDHLDGILILDHINSNLAQKMFLEKAAKVKKQAIRKGLL